MTESAGFREVSCTVAAVRVNDVIQTTFPVVAMASAITYDIVVTEPSEDSYPILRFKPTGNRWYRNIRIDGVGWHFDGKIVAGHLRAQPPEHPNSVECPA